MEMFKHTIGEKNKPLPSFNIDQYMAIFVLLIFNPYFFSPIIVKQIPHLFNLQLFQYLSFKEKNTHF